MLSRNQLAEFCRREDDRVGFSSSNRADLTSSVGCELSGANTSAKVARGRRAHGERKGQDVGEAIFVGLGHSPEDPQVRIETVCCIPIPLVGFVLDDWHSCELALPQRAMMNRARGRFSHTVQVHRLGGPFEAPLCSFQGACVAIALNPPIFQ